MQPDPSALDEVPALKATLELVQKAAGSNSTGQQMKPSALTATYLLFSSLDGEFSSSDRILTDIGHRLSQVLSVHKGNQYVYLICIVSHKARMTFTCGLFVVIHLLSN